MCLNSIIKTQATYPHHQCIVYTVKNVINVLSGRGLAVLSDFLELTKDTVVVTANNLQHNQTLTVYADKSLILLPPLQSISTETARNSQGPLQRSSPHFNRFLQ